MESGFKVFFLTSKSKVSPLKRVTILRLRFVDFDDRSFFYPFECKDDVLSESLSSLFTETDNFDNDIGLSKIINVGKYSTLQKLTNVTEFVYRFISNIKSKINRRPVINNNFIRFIQSFHQMNKTLP